MPWCFKIDTFGYDDNDFDEDDDGGCGSGGDDDDDDSCGGSGACVDADNGNNVNNDGVSDDYDADAGANDEDSDAADNNGNNDDNVDVEEWSKGHPTYRISKINLEGSRSQSLMGTYPLFPDPCLWGTDIFIFSLTYTDFLIFPRGRDSTQQT